MDKSPIINFGNRTSMYRYCELVGFFVCGYFLIEEVVIIKILKIKPKKIQNLNETVKNRPSAE
jgi:hypothetical protein